MPNWCTNDVTLRHKDPAVIERAVKAYQEGRFLQEFIPCPEELQESTATFNDSEQEKRNLAKYGFGSWYDWNIAHWGTKWDIGGRNEFADQPDANTLELKFDSAWSPPIEAYRALAEQGFEVEAYYHEPGMAFCGTYDREYGENTIEYSGWTAAQIREEIPELDERFCISEWMEEVEEDRE